MHPETDQFLRLDAGRGRVQMGRSRDNLEFDEEVSDGWCILVPAGTWHNVTNIANEPMQLYAIYAPAHHKPGKVHATAAEAAADTDDEPASWSVQPVPAPTSTPENGKTTTRGLRGQCAVWPWECGGMGGKRKSSRPSRSQVPTRYKTARDAQLTSEYNDHRSDRTPPDG